jgi:ABC-2 type transport system ATP-binding protein
VESAEKALPAILEAANRCACRLEFIDYHRPKLDDVFVAHTGHAIREDFPKDEA